MGAGARGRGRGSGAVRVGPAGRAVRESAGRGGGDGLEAGAEAGGGAEGPGDATPGSRGRPVPRRHATAIGACGAVPPGARGRGGQPARRGRPRPGRPASCAPGQLSGGEKTTMTRRSSEMWWNLCGTPAGT
ncbi:hypothetical protein GCM10023324_06380 [Streptomyces youssoufiensis]